MFIELTRENEKILLNTNEILCVSPFMQNNEEFSMITLCHPTTIRGGVGTIKLAVKESYKEIKSWLHSQK